MTARSRRPWAARVYGWALWVLPPWVRRADAEEMSLAFAELWAETSGVARRAALLLRMLARIPAVALAEWLDLLAAGDRETTGGGIMTGWGRNLAFALRTLRKSPAFTITTVMLIGLGVGAVTTIFTLVDHVLLRPLPYPDADRLVTVQRGAHSGLVVRALEDFSSVEAWAAGNSHEANLVGQGDPRRIQEAVVSRGFFSLFGGRPALGRLLVEEDFIAADAVVLSHGTWTRVFGSDDRLLGRTIRIDDEPVTVVGVLQPGFDPPRSLMASEIDVWRPIDWSQEELSSPEFSMLEVAGRLAPGATEEEAQAELDALSLRMAALYPEDMVDRNGDPVRLPVAGLQASTVQRVRTGLNLLLAAVALLLLVACLNVAHLFLARGLGRLPEMAIRRALGAGAGGLLQQLLVESLVVGLVGGAVGVGIAWMGLDLFMALDPGTLPVSSRIGLDLRVLGFAAGVSVSTAVLFGLLPALRSVGSDATDGLRGGERGSSTGRRTARLRSALVVAEVALSLVLLAQAGLLLRSFIQVQAHDPGFEPEGLWTLPLTPVGAGTPEEYVMAMDEVETALASVPGVVSATYGLTQPFQYTGSSRCCWSTRGMVVEGEERDDLRVAMQPVSRTYFRTLDVEMLAGSVWLEAEEVETPVPVVLSERLAVELFGSTERALGQVVGGPRLDMRVVGVAADTKHYGLDQDAPDAAYLPISRVPFAIRLAHMAVRLGAAPPEGIAGTLRRAVWQAAPEMPVPTVRPMTEWIERSTAGRRFDSAVFAAFGVVAVLLAAAGLYGTLLYNVRQRRRELGIRLALGAARSGVERQVVGSGVRLAVVGSVLGLLGAWQAGRFLEGRLYQVDAGDPTTLAVAVAVLIGVAAVASWIPARRAGLTDPLQTLKAE